MLLKISDYFKYMCCIDTKLFDITQHATLNVVSFKTTDIQYEHNVYVLYHTQINCIITTQISPKLSLCRYHYIPMYRH